MGNTYAKFGISACFLHKAWANIVFPEPFGPVIKIIPFLRPGVILLNMESLRGFEDKHTSTALSASSDNSCIPLK
jgi:hypothetical protein